MAQKANSQRPAWLLPVLVGVVALLVLAIAIAYLVFSDRTPSSDAAQDPRQGGGVVDVHEQAGEDALDLSFVETRDAQDPQAIGEADAPVTMVVFSDYQCPFCAAWSHETLPVMMDYVDEEVLRIEWRDVSVFGPESERAAQAAYAAGLQGKFWEYHAALYADGEVRAPDQLSEDGLLAIADELGLNAEQFGNDLNSEVVATATVAHQQLGFDIGAYSTPAFVIGGQPVVGAQPSDVFVAAVEQALDTAS